MKKTKKGQLKITKKGLVFYYTNRKGIYVDRIIYLLLIPFLILLVITSINKINKSTDERIKEITNVEIKESIKEVEPQPVVEVHYVEETLKEAEVHYIQESKPILLDYRMTYYYPNDSTNSGTCTASGKCTKDFQINENGWYTYKGKLVVATAHESLKNWNAYKNSTQKTYKLYDELTLTIKGKQYDAIVLDKCGACMTSPKIDLFVKDNSSGLDTHIKVSE